MEPVEALEWLIRGKNLPAADADRLIRDLLYGDLPEGLLGGILIAHRVKGSSWEELAAFASVMRENVAGLALNCEDVVDTCGTGGGVTTFNLSTGAAIVAAAAGAKIAKHGNRSVTSKCGSADVLEELGANLALSQEGLLDVFSQTGIVFMFAPDHHAGLKSIGAVRRQLGVRTVFNQLGPLANPAGAKRQLIGVYQTDLLEPVARALQALNSERAMVAHSVDGLDEISPSAPTHLAILQNGQVSYKCVLPGEFGLGSVPRTALDAGVDVAESAKILKMALSDVDCDQAKCLLPNCAATLLLGGLVESFKDGAEMALSAIADKSAEQKLEQFIEATRGAKRAG